MAINPAFKAPHSRTWDLLRRLTGLAEPENHLRGYPLHLEDGSQWWFAGLSGGNPALEELAAVLDLQPGVANGGHVMVILEGEDPPKTARRLGEPESHWISLGRTNRKLKASDSDWLSLSNELFNLWHRQDSQDLVLELKRDLPRSSGIYGYNCLKCAVQFIFHQSIKRGGVPLHAALLERQGAGALVVGTSGTGKSTCCRRLVPPWQPRCDDHVLVTLAPDGRYLAHPFPTWSDYFSQKQKGVLSTQKSCEVAGIFFLEQSSQDDCRPAEPSQALIDSLIAAQVALVESFWFCGPEEARVLRSLIFANTCELLKKVPSFRLEATLTGRFWEKMEAVLGMR